ncbi:hypothetical protein DFQ27_008274 [Actinomortierella ambigua]|uniref:Metallo-beta-lactamase domain-containing protein n=1 Tax=Actinomortierella ambigua TaxID=1343610 RepID=A0A9P6QG07_9FUNG|nr:hypothetical protein DFQ27_008274 [Actinomortierella ambigua]
MLAFEPNEYPDLIELDSLQLRVIVDNEIDHMSAGPAYKSGQAQELYRDPRNRDPVKSKPGSGSCGCGDHDHGSDDTRVDTVAFDFEDLVVAGHGLSMLCIGVKDGKEHRVLFDTGPTPSLYRANARRLEVDHAKIEAIVLSHWHIDHSGGMLEAVKSCTEARRHQPIDPVVVDLHPDRPDQRGACLKRPTPEDDRYEYVAWGADPTLHALEKEGAKIALNDKAHTLCEGYFGVSGEIPRRTSYETGLPSHSRWFAAEGCWKDEQEIMDERYLVARVKDRGLVVLSGCSHAGIVNVCQDVHNAFKTPASSSSSSSSSEIKSNHIALVAGGFHLAGGHFEARIPDTVRDLQEIGPELLAPGHCSGWKARAACDDAMPGRVVSLGGGSVYTIAPFPK